MRWFSIGALLACSNSAAPPCPVFTETLVLGDPNPGLVDLLLVVDNSNDMAEEQVLLARELPTLIRALGTGDVPDPLPDGELDFEPVRSLHVGVVTADLGAGGRDDVRTCGEGDDGVLRNTGNVAISGYRAEYPRFLEFREGDNPEMFASTLECIAIMGTRGCGFEQPLESMLKAITPSTSAITFEGFTFGHADGINAGFRRDDALLAVLVLTDEDDCSAADPELYSPEEGRYQGDLNLRCFNYPEALHPVTRYAEGLLDVVPSADRLVFATISGLPSDIERESYETILDDERMQEHIDPTMPTRIRPACNMPGVGITFPPRRIVGTAAALEDAGVRTLVRSICRERYEDPIRDFIAEIAIALGDGSCLSRPLPRTMDGLADCELIERVMGAEECSLPGREDMGLEGEDRLCRVRQLSPDEATAGLEGWYFDERSPEASERCGLRPFRIARVGPGPVAGTRVALRCATSDDGLGSSCEDDLDCFTSPGVGAVFPLGLGCLDALCQPRCETRDDCAGFACHDGVCDTLECSVVE